MKLTTEISLNLLALIFNSFLQLFLRAIIWKNQLVKKSLNLIQNSTSIKKIKLWYLQ